jgi:2-C-methyl-D-erythritol 4-phosphate cytidylyltransferase
MHGLVLTAAGSSTRFGRGGVSKVLRTIAGKPVLLRALAPFRIAVRDLAVVVTARVEDVAAIRRLVLPEVRVVPGGETRQESVRRGVEALPADVAVVLVHDAARPLLSADLVRAVLAAAVRDGAAAAVLGVTDSLHRLVPNAGGDPRIGDGVDRARLVAAQTPQAARADLLRRAIAEAEASGASDTDEIGLLRRAGIPVTAVEGERWNLKITVPEDLELAERLLDEGAEVR